MAKPRQSPRSYRTSKSASRSQALAVICTPASRNRAITSKICVPIESTEARIATFVNHARILCDVRTHPRAAIAGDVRPSALRGRRCAAWWIDRVESRYCVERQTPPRSDRSPETAPAATTWPIRAHPTWGRCTQLCQGTVPFPPRQSVASSIGSRRLAVILTV